MINALHWLLAVSLMYDDIRERVHMELAPCTNEEFINRYLELDPDFEKRYYDTFGISLEV